MIDRNFALAGIAILTAEFSINIGAAVAKGLFPLVGPEGVAALRTSIAALVLLAIVRPWRRRLGPEQAGWLLLYGLALGGMNLLIYWSFERIPIGIAVAIEISGPLAVVLLTSRTVRDFVWLGLAVCGVLLLVPWPGGAAGLDPVGIGFALGAAALWALYILCGKRASEAGSGMAVAIGMCWACAVTLPFGLVEGGAGLLRPEVLGLGTAVALLSSAIPYALEMKALKTLSSRVFGLITSSAPAVAALAGFLILGERLTAMQWLAVSLMIAACAGCSITAKPPVSRPSKDALV